MLYARSRRLPLTLGALAAISASAAWAAYGFQDGLHFDHAARFLVLTPAPLLASAAVGVSLYTHAEELDPTAGRPWWPRRLVHLLALTALAVGLLALAVGLLAHAAPGHPEQFGAPAVARNVLGACGVTAGAAAVLGARLSWLPMAVYAGAVHLAAPRTPGGFAAVWAWWTQPGPQAAAWGVAAAAFLCGGALYVWRGARAEGSWT
ncbi:hypothetical protein NLX86_27685 [Streptomyces sp. A3M-1-3]|uniref:hypothetical protein n=1 Tax=Streptomyces sp. A3M-1-3 TaxID=2962044 RepID=UPI0020B8D2C3|nr:hypothetical protein [Streptomyces sp. A3M-1-3]